MASVISISIGLVPIFCGLTLSALLVHSNLGASDFILPSNVDDCSDIDKVYVSGYE